MSFRSAIEISESFLYYLGVSHIKYDKTLQKYKLKNIALVAISIKTLIFVISTSFTFFALLFPTEKEKNVVSLTPLTLIVRLVLRTLWAIFDIINYLTLIFRGRTLLQMYNDLNKLCHSDSDQKIEFSKIKFMSVVDIIFVSIFTVSGFLSFTFLYEDEAFTYTNVFTYLFFSLHVLSYSALCMHMNCILRCLLHLMRNETLAVQDSKSVRHSAFFEKFHCAHQILLKLLKSYGIIIVVQVILVVINVSGDSYLTMCRVLEQGFNVDLITFVAFCCACEPYLLMIFMTFVLYGDMYSEVRFCQGYFVRA